MATSSVENWGLEGRYSPSGAPESGRDDPFASRLALERETRIRIALGVPGRQRLPQANASTLLKFHRYLAARLEFPFDARYSPEATGEEQTVRVLALLDPREWDRGRFAGLLCEVEADGRTFVAPLVELEVGVGDPNFQELEDYWYWFWNWRNLAMRRLDV